MEEQYRLFFSWQNDRKDTKKVINGALRKVEEQLKKEGLELLIDQDTRERVGKRNIDAEVLEKIRKCDIFVADLTPVITYMPPTGSHDLPKHMPNSNVMYEYGYALHAKGENRMIVLASLNKEENEHIEYMPFDINHDTITLFNDENSLRGLYGWIKKIIEDVDRERAETLPQYACTLLFRTDAGWADEITIKPKYKRVWHTAKSRHIVQPRETGTASIIEALCKPLTTQQMLLSNMRVPSQIVTAKVISKTTNYSFVPIHLIFVNQGTEPLDNLKIQIKASDSRVLFDESNETHQLAIPRVKSHYDTFADEKGIFQRSDTLNPHDSIIFDEVFVHAPHDLDTFHLEWTLSSRSFQCEGMLTVHVEPDYEYASVENDELAGTERVEDYKEKE